ncbi:MAG TPA: hypothetical protein VFK89_06290 [Actinomycetota bacterium]|nr:hypothetical protein [Actinomycetota bacterium]
MTARDEREITSLLQEMSTEITRVRPLTRRSATAARLRRTTTAVIASFAIVATVTGGVAVAARVAAPPTTTIAGEPSPQPTSTDGSEENRPTPSGESIVMSSTYGAQPFTVGMLPVGYDTCFEVEFDRSRDDNPGTCTAPAGHDLYYSAAAVPGGGVVVFGAITDAVDSVRISPDGADPTVATLHATSDSRLTYFEQFSSSAGLATLDGKVTALDSAGEIVEEGRLCARHVWDENGDSLCE